MDPEKIKSIEEFPKPAKVEAVQSFLGLCNYYRKCIDKFADIAAPLYDLTELEPLVWNPEAEAVFVKLKKALTEAPVLEYADVNADIRITCDASLRGLVGICEQSTDGRTWHPIAYCSRTLRPGEQKYSTTQRECLAVLSSLQQFRPYFYGRRAQVVTDRQALKHMATMKDPYNQLARLSPEIGSYNVEIVH